MSVFGFNRTLDVTKGSVAISLASPVFVRDCFVTFAESILSEAEGLWDSAHSLLAIPHTPGVYPWA